MLGFLTALVSIGFICHVLAAGKRSSSINLAWILSFIALPILSWIFYLLVGVRSYSRRRRLHRLYTWPEIRAKNPQNPPAQMPVWGILSEQLSDFKVTIENQITLISKTSESYDLLESAITNAKSSVLLEYYIFTPDRAGIRFKELLIKAAKRGVSCKLLVDHMGSFGLGKSFIEEMTGARVAVAEFSPVSLWNIGAAHLRNHRKMAIIDGAIGFIGSSNIGEEYLSQLWRDTSLLVEGPLVEQMELLFCEDWHAATRERIVPETIHNHQRGRINKGSAPAILLPSGPDETEDGLEMTLCSLFHLAKTQVHITTPYFVPSHAILLALRSATKRGVKVEILIPTHSDQWYMDHIAIAWANDLSAQGIHIYRTQGQFTHSKVVTVDSKTCLVGSANMDVRSFRLNFEVNLLTDNPKLCQGLDAEFEHTLSTSILIKTEKPFFRHPFLLIKDGFFKTVSPLF